MELQEPLLATKLYIPPTRPALVPRPRLVEQLDNGLHRKLALISAPAGFGKTTLITEWLDCLRLQHQNSRFEISISWLSLDAGDNDLLRFLSYFIAALVQTDNLTPTFGDDVLNLLQSPEPPPSEAVLTTLINEIAASQTKFLLILDDYHLIEAQPIHDALSFLIENLPPNLHLVIATREDPLISLSRLLSFSTA
jgi:LuxR family maltose regulon positive regulatory protein